jgi:hypothetical protein
MTPWIALFALMMVLDTAHVVSPILLAWWRPELRRIAVAEWPRFVLAPVVIIPACVLAPWEWVTGLYFAWNIHHFGAQNFGLWQLYGGKCSPDARVLRGAVCLGVTAFGMAALPILMPGAIGFLLFTALFSFTHWLTDIGVSSRVAPRGMMFIGLTLLAGFLWLVLRQGPLSVHVVSQILAIRSGMGMVHFVYSARIWKHDAAVSLLRREPSLTVP